VVPVSKVQNYGSTNQDAATMSRQEIGKHFDADYVVCLDLGPMTLYEKGCRGQLYQGSVEVTIEVIDVAEPEGAGLKYRDVYSCTFPRRGPEDAGSMSPVMFRHRFLYRVARDLVPYLAACPSKDMIDAV